jgi:hypothetical protein
MPAIQRIISVFFLPKRIGGEVSVGRSCLQAKAKAKANAREKETTQS